LRRRRRGGRLGCRAAQLHQEAIFHLNLAARRPLLGLPDRRPDGVFFGTAEPQLRTCSDLVRQRFDELGWNRAPCAVLPRVPARGRDAAVQTRTRSPILAPTSMSGPHFVRKYCFQGVSHFSSGRRQRGLHPRVRKVGGVRRRGGERKFNPSPKGDVAERKVSTSLPIVCRRCVTTLHRFARLCM
jgi:hypothetical protein